MTVPCTLPPSLQDGYSWHSPIRIWMSTLLRPPITKTNQESMIRIMIWPGCIYDRLTKYSLLLYKMAATCTLPPSSQNGFFTTQLLRARWPGKRWFDRPQAPPLQPRPQVPVGISFSDRVSGGLDLCRTSGIVSGPWGCAVRRWGGRGAPPSSSERNIEPVLVACTAEKLGMNERC